MHVITFTTAVPVSKTLVFEEVYPEELRLDAAEKQHEIAAGGIWLLVDGVLAAEAYGIRASDVNPDDVHGDITDTERDSFYCSSTTVLPKYQGAGLGKLLKVYQLGVLKAKGYTLVTGHATSPSMKHIITGLGGKFIREHKDWYGTGKTAWFYTLYL